MLVMAFTLLFAFTITDDADARRGGFKSGPRSYTTTPKKQSNNVNKSDTTTSNKSNATTSTANTTKTGGGLFGGGGFMKGMMLGGLAGLLFGGLFANMGFMGELLGLAINLFAIYIIVALALSLFRKFKKPQTYQGPRNDDYDNRGGRF